MNTHTKQLQFCLTTALRKALKTLVWLLKIIIPISLAVSCLQYFGIIAWFATYLSPCFAYIGLRGEAAIVFITSCFTVLYAPIAIIATLDLTLREITILALMCLISHNLIVETAVQHKTGTSPWIILPLRIGASLVCAFILNALLPQQMGDVATTDVTATIYHSIGEMLAAWGKNTFFLIVKMSCIITALMLLQTILKEFRWIDAIARFCEPLMRIMGLSRDCSFLWFIAQIVGLTYGSAVLLEELKEHAIAQHDVHLLNYHIALNHSLLEDTSLFLALGVPTFWIIVPRFIAATACVWIVRLHRHVIKQQIVNRQK